MFENLIQLQRDTALEVRAPWAGRRKLYVPVPCGQVVRTDYGGPEGKYGVPVCGGVGLVDADAVEEVPYAMAAWFTTRFSVN